MRLALWTVRHFLLYHLAYPVGRAIDTIDISWDDADDAASRDVR